MFGVGGGPSIGWAGLVVGPVTRIVVYMVITIARASGRYQKQTMCYVSGRHFAMSPFTRRWLASASGPLTTGIATLSFYIVFVHSELRWVCACAFRVAVGLRLHERVFCWAVWVLYSSERAHRSWICAVGSWMCVGHSKHASVGY